MSKSPTLPLFADNLGVPQYLMGFVAAASTIPGILISLPAGSLSDTYGRRRILILSAFIFASAPFLYIFVTFPWQLVLVRFYHGFATAMFVPVASAAVLDSFPDKKGEKVSTFSSATLIGRGIAPFLAGYLLSITSSSFSSVYTSIGIVGIAAFGTSLALYRINTTEAAAFERPSQWKGLQNFFRDWARVATTRGIIATSMVEAAMYFTFGAFEFFLALYAKSLGFDSLSIGVIMGAQIITVMVSKPFLGRVSDRHGRRMPILVGLIIGSLPLIATPFATHLLELAAISIVYGLGLSTVTSSTIALVSDLTRQESYGASIGFLRTIMDIGQALGPISTGIILEMTTGYFIAFFTLGGILLAFFLFFYALIGRKTENP